MIAVVGSPNSGKTTLFNRLTGLSAKTVNYPGSTVDLLYGRWGEWDIIDTPGIYSLEARSPDEEVTVRALVEKQPRVVMVVVDATQASRQLAMARQVIRFSWTGATKPSFKVVLVVTMLDLLRREGQAIDLERLTLEIGAKAVGIDATSHDSIVRDLEKLRAAVAEADSVQTAVSVADVVVDAVSVADDLNRARDIVARVIKPLAEKPAKRTPREFTRAIDRWILHPVFGPVLFVAAMTLLFASIYWLAAPLMEVVDGGVSWVSALLAKAFAPIESSVAGSLASRFVTGGVVAGLGAILVFVPQIFILFCGVAILEDTGYLARAAALVDRPLKALGLGGRSFVPLLSGFACAVPAMLAARTINSRRERGLTLFVLPLMSCSARLPVYALLLGFVLGDNALKAGFGLALLYFGSVVVGSVTAAIVNAWGQKRGWLGQEKSFFLLELPLYRRPRPLMVLKQAWLRTKSYVVRTGPTILVLSALIWAATTFPNFSSEDPAARLEGSFAAKAGQVLSPVFEPMGGDWRTGLGLISAFAAREVFVSTMAVIFHATETPDGDQQASILEKMKMAEAPGGGPLFTVASSLGLMLFFMIALQCLSTVAVAYRESASWRFAVVQLASFNALAYVLSVGLVQGLRLAGVP